MIVIQEDIWYCMQIFIYFFFHQWNERWSIRLKKISSSFSTVSLSWSSSFSSSSCCCCFIHCHCLYKIVIIIAPRSGCFRFIFDSCLSYSLFQQKTLNFEYISRVCVCFYVLGVYCARQLNLWLSFMDARCRNQFCFVSPS